MELQYYFSNDFSAFEEYFSKLEHRKRKFKTNAPISAIGEPMDEMYYIKSGTLRSTYLHESGNIKSFAFYGKGYMAPLYYPGEIDTMRSMGFTAVSELEVYVFNRESFLKYLDSNHELNKTMYGAYIKLVSLLVQESVNQLFCTGMEKVCNFFYIYLDNIKGDENIIHLSQNDISEHVGLNRVNVAKYLKILRAEKVIETHRNMIIVKNMEKLYEYCSEQTQLFLNK